MTKQQLAYNENLEKAVAYGADKRLTPKQSTILYRHAYDQSHSEGYEQVLETFEELVELYVETRLAEVIE